MKRMIFIPVGTRFTLLNEDTMLVEFWGKTAFGAESCVTVVKAV